MHMHYGSGSKFRCLKESIFRVWFPRIIRSVEIIRLWEIQKYGAYQIHSTFIGSMIDILFSSSSWLWNINYDKNGSAQFLSSTFPSHNTLIFSVITFACISVCTQPCPNMISLCLKQEKPICFAKLVSLNL